MVCCFSRKQRCCLSLLFRWLLERRREQISRQSAADLQSPRKQWRSMAISVDSTSHSVDAIRSLSRSVVKRTAMEDSAVECKMKECSQPVFSCVISFPLRLFFLTIFAGISILALLSSHIQITPPLPSPFTWSQNNVLPDICDLKWPENNVLPGIPDSEIDLSGQLDNTSLLTLSAIDPLQVSLQAEIKRLLDPDLPDRLHKLYSAGIRQFRLSASQVELMSVPAYLASGRVEAFWPEFQQRLKTWAFSKRFDPTVMKSLVSEIKAPLDKHYASKSKDLKYKRCAVVGNSGILLSQRYGSLIDSHDMVMRLNNARTFNFEPYVGTKTTLSFVNSNILHGCFGRFHCSCHPYGELVPIALYICQVPHLMDVAFCSKEHKAPILVTDPRLDTLLARLVKWYSLKEFVDNTNLPAWKWDSKHDSINFHYSSGLQAVIMSLGICDEVNLFGFGKNNTMPHHYHSRQRGELDLHDYEAEYMLYDDLVNRRVKSIPFLNESGLTIPPVHMYQ